MTMEQVIYRIANMSEKDFDYVNHFHAWYLFSMGAERKKYYNRIYKRLKKYNLTVEEFNRWSFGE